MIEVPVRFTTTMASILVLFGKSSFRLGAMTGAAETRTGLSFAYAQLWPCTPTVDGARKPIHERTTRIQIERRKSMAKENEADVQFLMEGAVNSLCACDRYSSELSMICSNRHYLVYLSYSLLRQVHCTAQSRFLRFKINELNIPVHQCFGYYLRA